MYPPVNLNLFWREYPHKILRAFEPLKEDIRRIADSRLGHSTLAAGRFLESDHDRITRLIKDKSFFGNPVLKAAIKHAREQKSNLHLVGLVSHGGVHSDLDHLIALLELCYRENFTQVYIDAITDGIDSEHYDGLRDVDEIERKIKNIGFGQFSSIGGRFYAMDRRKDHERSIKYFNVLMSKEKHAFVNIKTAIASSYRHGMTDFEIKPAKIKTNNQTTAIMENDAVIFFNFRSDRTINLIDLFVNQEFRHHWWQPKAPNNLFLASLTKCHNSPRVRVAFPHERVNGTLPEMLEKNHIRQLRLSEEEKKSHVTNFFNCRHRQFRYEDRKIIASQNVEDWADAPEASAHKVTKAALGALYLQKYDFILINYANADLVAHSGDIRAAATAIKVIDEETARVAREVLKIGGTTIVTADHGNIEQISRIKEGRQSENIHTVNPVPFILISDDYKKIAPMQLGLKTVTLEKILNAEGTLADVAPTILELMKIPMPPQMTGRSLLGRLE